MLNLTKKSLAIIATTVVALTASASMFSMNAQADSKDDGAFTIRAQYVDHPQYAMRGLEGANTDSGAIDPQTQPWNVIDDNLRIQIREMLSLEPNTQLLMSHAELLTNDVVANATQPVEVYGVMRDVPGFNWSEIQTAQGLEHSALTSIPQIGMPFLTSNGYHLMTTLVDTNGFENIEQVGTISVGENLTHFIMPELQTVEHIEIAQATNIESIDLPKLETASESFVVNLSPNLHHIVLPALTTVDYFQIDENISSLSMPLLEQAGAFNLGASPLTMFDVSSLHTVDSLTSTNPTAYELTFPALTTITTDLTINGQGVPTVELTAFNAPMLETIGRYARITTNIKFISFNTPSLTSIGGTMHIEIAGVLYNSLDTLP